MLAHALIPLKPSITTNNINSNKPGKNRRGYMLYPIAGINHNNTSTTRVARINNADTTYMMEGFLKARGWSC